MTKIYPGQYVIKAIKMNRMIPLLILSLFVTMEVAGQIGLINDPDGYTNVRKEPSVRSEILYQVKEEEVFFIDIEYMDLQEDWILVHIPKNKFSKHDTNGEPYDLSGYIHKSRIRVIESLPIANDRDVKLVFHVVKVISDKEPEQGTYGLDIPVSMAFEVKDLTLEWEGKQFPQSAELYDDLYNVSFSEGVVESDAGSFTLYFSGDTFLIRQKCGDGGGYYEIVWVIRGGKIVQRLAGWIT